VIPALMAWGIGFGGVEYVVTHGLSVGAAGAPAHRIFRDLVSGSGDLLRAGTGGNPDTFRGVATGSGKVFR
jgi:hypothetical protein